jgi:integrase/recombinase XerD
MHLKFSTDEYLLNWNSTRGFPILLNEDMTSQMEVNQFFRYYLQRAMIESENSWMAISRALYDFFGFLEAQSVDWRDVDRGEEMNVIAGYREYCTKIAKLKRNTVRHRVLYVCEFYKYAAEKQWINKLPYAFEMRNMIKADGFLAHIHNNKKEKKIRDVMPKKHNSMVKFLTFNQAKQLLGAAQNVHHHIMIKMALQTGLRREELATFPLAYVFDPDETTPNVRNVRVILDPEDGHGMKTKGKKRREILMPRETMKALHRYVVHHRGARSSLTNNQNPQLFLNQDGNPWAQSGKGIEAMVRKIGRTVGIETHPHMLRHTYATLTLVTLQRNRQNNGIEPLVFLQEQLGHASIRSVMVYLHIVNKMADDAVISYSDEIDELGE